MLYYQKLLANFQNITNCTTQIRPLEEKNFEFEINDKLLEQYFLQIQSEIDNSPYTNPNYNVATYSSIIKTTYQKMDEPEITILSNSYKYKLTITNDNNYAKLLINILNALSLWLSLTVMDLHVYVFKLLGFVKKFHFLLLKLENRLRPNRFII